MPIEAGSSELSLRLALILLGFTTIAATTFAALAAYGLPKDMLGWSVLILFVLAMSGPAFAAWRYLYGFMAVRLGKHARSALERRSETISPQASGLSRSAVLVSTSGGDPIAVFAAVRAMARSLRREGGEGSDIDLFVISDAREGAISAVEEHEFNRIRTWAGIEGPGIPRIRYQRWLPAKGGIIAAFCAEHGHDYDFMIPLGGDGLMSGATLRRLVRLMEEHPRIGLIQTVPCTNGGGGLFARIRHFAMRLYRPLGLRGQTSWNGQDGFWGRNAILRIEAIAESGVDWECHLLPEINGSWMVRPTNLVDHLGHRTRQSGRLLPLKNLPWARPRIGMPAELAHPIWVGFLALGTVQAVRTGDLGLLGFGLSGFTPAAWTLAGLVIVTMTLPNILSLANVLINPQSRAAFGGTVAFLKSAALEQLAWMLLWPVMTLSATGALLAALVGSGSRHDARIRQDRSMHWHAAFRRQANVVATGLGLAALLIYAGNAALALWMAPVALALIASPAALLLDQSNLGLPAKAHGLFRTQDDTARAPELAEFDRFRLPAKIAPARAASANRLSAGINTTRTTRARPQVPVGSALAP